MSLSKSALRNFFLLAVLLELFLMGSGRSFEIGPLTLRMVFFVTAITYSIIFSISEHRADKQMFWFVIVFILLMSLGAFIGFVNGAEPGLILNDIKPLAYFLMIMYFYVSIKDMKTVNLTITAIKFASFIMAFIYLLVLVLLYFNRIDYNEMYSFISNNSEEISFREDTGFFYKGFIYLCIGFIFYLFDERRIGKLIAAFIFLAIVLSFTRGLLFSTVIVIAIYMFMLKKNMKFLLYFVLFFSTIAYLTPKAIDMYGDKSESDSVRIVTIEQVFNDVSEKSVLVGHGLGIGVSNRPEHMEISFLEIFHKQGIVGILLWFSILMLLVTKYFRAIQHSSPQLALPFLLASLLVFIQSFTNPYINNPIGMSMVLISISALNVLGKPKYA